MTLKEAIVLLIRERALLANEFNWSQMNGINNQSFMSKFSKFSWDIMDDDL